MIISVSLDQPLNSHLLDPNTYDQVEANIKFTVNGPGETGNFNFVSDIAVLETNIVQKQQ